jgi:hypothetical protein
MQPMQAYYKDCDEWLFVALAVFSKRIVAMSG